MIHAPPQLQAGGNIYPARFIKADPSNEGKCIQATANSKSLGVSQVGTNYPPLNDPAVTVSGYAATEGQTIEFHAIGQVCLVEAGAAINPGDDLKPDADGKAVPIASSGTTLQRIGARAIGKATEAGHFIRCFVMPGSERPAIA